MFLHVQDSRFNAQEANIAILDILNELNQVEIEMIEEVQVKGKAVEKV